MYKAFVAVLHDLLIFVVRSVKSLFKKGTGGVVVTDKESVRPSNGFKAGVDLGYTVYVVQDGLVCFKESKMKGERVATFTYGDRLQQSQVLEDAVFVTDGEVEGWVDASGIAAAYEQVFPTFVPFVMYDASDEQVKKVRKYLSHFTRKSKQVLSAEEFVLYKLLSTGVTIPWEIINASSPQSWYQRLLGRRGIAISDEPKTHSILEYTTKAGDFVQGYVTEVHPDRTIVLESVGRVHAGEYRVEQISPFEWKTWQPSFITFL